MLLFQFHKGTIRTQNSFHCCNEMYHFNSIKVRLEQLGRANNIEAAIIFQFHKGTIRT